MPRRHEAKLRAKGKLFVHDHSAGEVHLQDSEGTPFKMSTTEFYNMFEKHALHPDDTVDEDDNDLTATATTGASHDNGYPGPGEEDDTHETQRAAARKSADDAEREDEDDADTDKSVKKPGKKSGTAKKHK